MENKEMVKLKRGNRLSNLFDEIFQAKMKKLTMRYEALSRIRLFTGQHFNPLRQEKHRIMAQQGMKTGKQFRQYMKELRAKNRQTEV